METTSLNEVARRTRGDGTGIAGGASLEVVLGKIFGHMQRQERDSRDLDRAVQTINIPAVQFPLSGDAVTNPPATMLLGPEDGYAWDLRRITVQGLTAAQVVSLFKEVNNPRSGNPQNFLWTFSAPGTSPGPTWNPGGGLVLRAQEQLLLTGTGLTAAPVLSGEGTQVAMPWLSRYLL